MFRSDLVLMDETQGSPAGPYPQVPLDARTNSERLDAALTRIERVLREFEARLAWK